MANIINNNFYQYKLKVNRDEYWDVVINRDYDNIFYTKPINKIYEEDLISYLNFSSNLCYNNGKFISDEKYFWDKATVTEYDLTHIGFTGLDNGLIPFRRDLVTNEEFLDIYQNSTCKVGENNTSLVFHPVSGGTNLYIYPFKYEDETLKLNGGFLQSFFETECEKYRVLPDYFNNGDVIGYEFVLKPSEFKKNVNESGKEYITLNEKYPNNKGIFFYIGTRAENKWIYVYEKDEYSLSYDDYIEDAHVDKKSYILESFINLEIDEEQFTDEYKRKENMFDGFQYESNFENEYFDLVDGFTIEDNLTETKIPCESCDFFGDDYILDVDTMEDRLDYVENELDIIDFIYRIDDSLTIGIYEHYLDITNPFLLFNRTCDGYTTSTWKDGSFIRYVGIRNTFKENLFLIMNRTCTGYTVNNIEELREQYDEKYDVYKDLYENALAFRITDAGEIGYRYLVKDCNNTPTYKIEEGYSKKNIVKLDNWSVIHVKIYMYYKDMVLRFYVNGKLVFISKPLPKLNLRQLDELYEKQEGVPFNISLGGGTQGLAETILPNYMLDPYRLYPLEEYFAGTFIGEIKSFKIYNNSIEYKNIFNNYVVEKDRLTKK